MKNIKLFLIVILFILLQVGITFAGGGGPNGFHLYREGRPNVFGEGRPSCIGRSCEGHPL